MRIFFLPLFAALLIAGGAPAIAAECATEVERATAAVKAMKNADRKRTADKSLEMAREAQRDKMEGECLKHAAMALEGAAKDGE